MVLGRIVAFLRISSNIALSDKKMSLGEAKCWECAIVNRMAINKRFIIDFD